MNISILRSWKELSVLESEWNDLLARSRANTLFLTWEWVQAWHAVVGESKQLYVVVVRDDTERLVGIAPFYACRLLLFNLIPYRTLRIIADYSTGFEYADWIADSELEKPVLAAIAQALSASRDWDVIWMPRISGWSGAFERITQALDAYDLLYHHRSSPFSAFTIPDSLKAFEESFSAKRRQQMRRNRRNLMSTPGVDIAHCRNHKDLPRFIDSLFDLHHQRRMLLGDPGCFIRKPAEAAFYREFLPKALDNGWLRLAALTQDGVIEAIQIGYAYDGEFLQMQEGFNPDYTSGAGNVLRHIVIEESIEEGLNSYDFLGGFTEHKRRWGAQERFGHELLIGRPSLKTRLLFLKQIWPTGRYIKELGLFDGN